MLMHAGNRSEKILKIMMKASSFVGIFSAVIENAKEIFMARNTRIEICCCCCICILDEVLSTSFLNNVIILRFVDFVEWRVYENVRADV